MLTKNILADDATVSGNLTIVAGGDVDIDTLQLRNRSESSWGNSRRGGYSITDTTTNLRSNINSAADITIVSNDSSVLVKGSNLNADSNITLAAKDQATISSALNTHYQESGFHSKGFSVTKSSMGLSNTTTNLQSNLVTGGDLNIVSGSDTNILASNLTGQGDGIITAGKYLDSDANSSTYNQEILNPDAKVNIFNGVDSNNSQSYSNKSKTGILSQIPIVAQGVQLINKAAMGSTYRIVDTASFGAYSELTDNSKQRLNLNSANEQLVASNLNFGNNLSIATANDLNIRSSNLKTTTASENTSNSSSTGNISLISGNNINITAAQANNSSSRNEDGKSDRKTDTRNINITETQSTRSTLESANNITIIW